MFLFVHFSSSVLAVFISLFPTQWNACDLDFTLWVHLSSIFLSQYTEYIALQFQGE